jgi:hypothetical protein
MTGELMPTTLTGTIRVLEIDDRRLTWNILWQLDRADLNDVRMIGRVNDRARKTYWIIGTNASGNLVRCSAAPTLKCKVEDNAKTLFYVYGDKSLYLSSEELGKLPLIILGGGR